MASRPDNDEQVRFDVDLARIAIAFAVLTILAPALMVAFR